METDNQWYKTTVFYQIWTRSFCDGNGDGIGDLYGVLEKLDYLKSLGITGIWFSPLYPSPNADYGYDISDYKNISGDYGNLDIFKKVLDKAHHLGMKVIMDLVINHTSDEHPWFKASCEGRDNEYSDYYIWRDGKDNGKLPNNWESLFGGKAWEYNPKRGQYYLHLFDKKQPDLNMDNPKVRQEIKSIMRFWLDMGVDGFREDVITFISKREGLPNGLPFIPAGNGIMHYKDGPNIHKYLKEFREVCNEYHAFQLGEGPCITPGSALKYIKPGPDQELDAMFNFDHMTADCFMTEYVATPFRLRSLTHAFSKWQNRINGKGWNTLYLENHDHPRSISRYGSEKYHDESGKMLAVSFLFQQGTPFIYQGQEIGMTNIRLRNIEQYKDVSSISNYYSYHKNESHSKRLMRIHRSSRDSSRTPMQWSGEKYAGFSDVKPWFFVNNNYKEINVDREQKDCDSVLNFYKKAIHIRKNQECILMGDYKQYNRFDTNIYMYTRHYKENTLLVICSFTDQNIKCNIPSHLNLRYGKLLLSNYNENTVINGRTIQCRPYESRVYLFHHKIKK